MDTVIDRIGGEEQFAIAFAAAQHWTRAAMRGDYAAAVHVKSADAELQDAFELLPEALQTAILKVHAKLDVTPSKPRGRSA